MDLQSCILTGSALGWDDHSLTAPNKWGEDKGKQPQTGPKVQTNKQTRQLLDYSFPK